MHENVFDRLLKEAVTEMIQREMEVIPEKRILRERYHLSSEFYGKMAALLKNMDQRARKASCRRWILAGAVSACFLLAVFKPELLTEAKEAIWRWYDTHVRFYFEQGSEIEPHHYYMEHVPEGYEIVFDFQDVNQGILRIENKEGDYLELNYFFSDSEMLIDNKEKELYVKEVGDVTAYYMESPIGEENVLTWTDPETDVLFSLYASDLTYPDLEAVMKGVCMEEE